MQRHTLSLAERTTSVMKAVQEAAVRLHLSSADLGMIMGVSQSIASGVMRGEVVIRPASTEWEQAVLIVRLHGALVSLVGGDSTLALGWFNSPNRAFADARPVDVVQRPNGLASVCEYLDAHRRRC